MSANPYASPDSDRSPSEGSEGRQAFQDLDTRQLKKLLSYSQTIYAIGALWFIGAILNVALLVAPMEIQLIVPAPVLMGFVALLLIAIIGCYVRQTWSRTVGIVAAVAAILLNLVTMAAGGGVGIIGIVINALVLQAYVSGSSLFGPERYYQGDIKAEFKQRKANGVA